MGVSYTKIIGAASVAAIVGIVALHSPVSAAPASFTWTGSAGDHKMSLVTGKKVKYQQKVLSWYLLALRVLLPMGGT